VLELQIRLDDLRSRCLPLVVAFGGRSNVQAGMAPCVGALECRRNSKASGL
jgi:hypothetical protein